MRVTAAALLIPISLALAAVASAQTVGEATRVQRFAFQTPPQATKAPLYRLDPVVRNARLETVPQGALEVTFADGSRLTLGSASTVVVDEFVYGGAQGTGAQTLTMTRGLFRFVSGSMPKDQVKLKTPTVTIGIRGTVVKVKTTDEKETVFFEQGTGFIDDGKGNVVPMGEGQMVTIEGGNVGQPKNEGWNAGEEAVDYGLNPFGERAHGPEGGSGGGDGAGASGGGANND
jgi:ferric-dicitrate binding protein FerR (iron transport regulator)